ncbi:MAG TPA: DUF72 domain-containing protein [Casimicrobiaceae bacterium]|nr:DUF72 domain-containing protein [Casimicrobiaceae bacterium]
MSMKIYALHFPVVEVQSTFYEPPRDEVMRKWRVNTPSLEYTMKVWQLVTHAANSPTYRRIKRARAFEDPGGFRDSPGVAQGWSRSIECASVLSATAMLFQSPASFRPEPDNVRRIERFFANIQRPRARLLWEPRGSPWMAKAGLASSLCRDLDLVHVVDPFVSPPQPDGPVYWRLHGIGGARNSYTDDQLNQLHRMLRGVEHTGPGYVLFNNLPRVGDAKRFYQLLATDTRASIRRQTEVVLDHPS